MTLREKLKEICDREYLYATRIKIFDALDAHERELVARIEGRRFPTCGCSSGCKHDEVNHTLDYILAFIQGKVVKDYLTTANDVPLLCPPGCFITGHDHDAER